MRNHEEAKARQKQAIDCMMSMFSYEVADGILSDHIEHIIDPTQWLLTMTEHGKKKLVFKSLQSLILYRHPRLLASAIAKDEVLDDKVLFKVNVGSKRL